MITPRQDAIEEFEREVARCHVAVVMPAYGVEEQIEAAVESIPEWVRTIIVVDDASPDGGAERVARMAQSDPRITLLRHRTNQGVGGAMKTGYAQALRVGADVVVKMDGDGQMDQSQLPRLVRPVMRRQADYAKGNRFRDFRALRAMPLVRRLGNAAMSFVCKWVTGYWNMLDPTNGFTAIHRAALGLVPLDSIASSYFFETSMLIHLNTIGAVVVDVPIRARYGAEPSSLKIRRVLIEFPPRFVAGYVRRMFLRRVLYDFSIDILYWIAGLGLLGFGTIFGVVKWIDYAARGVAAPTGTIMVAALPVILGFQLVLNAIILDITSVPRTPLCSLADDLDDDE